MSQIRIASPNDSAAIFEILSYGRPYGGRWSLSQVEDELRSGRTWILGVPDCRIAAFVCLRDQGAAWEITNLATHNAHLRKGLMQQLLRGVAGRLKPRKPIWLEVHEQNQPARQLYEKLGFVVSGRRPRYYPDGSEAILYTWEF